MNRQKMIRSHDRFVRSFKQKKDLPRYFQLGFQSLAMNTICLSQKYKHFAFFGLLGSEYLKILPEDIKESIKTFTLFSLSPDMAAIDIPIIKELLPNAKVSFEEKSEEDLTGTDQTFDIAILNNSMIYHSNFNNAFDRLQKRMVPDGCLRGVAPGPTTFAELRNSFYMAQSERRGGNQPIVPKFCSPAEIGNFLHKNAFRMSAVGTELIKLDYDSVIDFWLELSEWGFGGWLTNIGDIKKDDLFAAAAIHNSFFKNKKEGAKEGSVEVTFELLGMGGFKEAQDQMKKNPQQMTMENFVEFAKKEEERTGVKVSYEIGELLEEDEPLEEIPHIKIIKDKK